MGQITKHSHTRRKVSINAFASRIVFTKAIPGQRLTIPSVRDQAFLDSIVAEVAEKVQGKQVTAESDDDEAGNGTGKDS